MAACFGYLRMWAGVPVRAPGLLKVLPYGSGLGRFQRCSWTIDFSAPPLMSCFRSFALLILGGLSIFCTRGAGAQTFEQAVAPFPVRDTAGAAYEMPFLGGFNTPRPQLVDLDGDGDLDLFVQERRGRMAYFEHVDGESGPNFEWRTDYFQGLDVGAWARFGDLDGDGDPDLLAEEPISNVRYYQNVGSPDSPDFADPVGPLRRADGERLFAERQNVPVLTALDCEGPPDLVLGGLDGRLQYRRYADTRANGGPVFEKVSDAYQGVCVGPPSVCGSAIAAISRFSTRLHGANALTAGDLGGDGDPDLLWGDFFSDSLYLLENTGSCDDPNIERARDVYPVNEPIQTGGYNAPALGDIDGDNDQDLLVGVLGGSGSGASAVENLLFLEKTGAVADSTYNLRTRRFLHTVDVGGVSAPALVDLDDDGDLDLVVGNDAEPGGASARLHVFENVGAPSEPVYEQRSKLLLPDAEDGFNFVPAFGDVDSDGDPDLFLGTFSGTVRFYRNVGRATDPEFQRETEGDVTLPQGNFATPALTDIDDDGDLDLFVGSSSNEGVIAFFRNDGSPQSPDFQLEAKQFSDIRAGVRQTHPSFADLDQNGIPDLYLGTEAGVSVYRNTGTSSQAAFEAPPDSLGLPLRSLAAPAFADLNGDGALDLVAGGDGGGLKFFAGSDSTTAAVPPGAGVQVRPNPFQQRTRLAFSLRTEARVRLSVYDVMGRRVSVLVDRSLAGTEHRVPFPAEGRSSGVYLYVLRVDGRVRDRGRMVLVR